MFDRQGENDLQYGLEGPPLCQGLGRPKYVCIHILGHVPVSLSVLVWQAGNVSLCRLLGSFGI